VRDGGLAAGSERQVLAALGFGCLAVVLPLWLTPAVPMVDWPLHLGRAVVLSGSSPGLAEFVRPDWRPIPNLGLDLALSPLVGVLGADLAGRLFLTLVLVGLFSGAALVSRSLAGRWTPAACLPLAAAWDPWMLMGFVNFLMGLAIGLWTIGLWLAWPAKRRVGLMLAASAALGMVHLLTLLLVWYVIGSLVWIERRPGTRGPIWLAAGGALVMVAVQAARGGDPFSIQAKAYALVHAGFALPLGSGLGNHGWPVWHQTAGLGGLVVLGLLLGAAGKATPLRTVAVGLALAAALGPTLAFGTAFTAERLALPALLVGLASGLQVRWGWAALAVGIAALKSVLVSLAPGVSDVGDVRRALAGLAPGSTVVSYEVGRKASPYFDRVYLHAADWGVIDRGLFVPQLFLRPGQQPVAFTERAADFKAFQGNDPLIRDDWAGVWADEARLRGLQAGWSTERTLYLVVFHNEAARFAARPRASKVAGGERWSLIRLEP
jgi:hypothetical protein